MTAERNEEQQRSAAQPPGPSPPGPRPPEPRKQRTPGEQQKGPPHNFRFAVIALGIAVAAFALTMLLFRGLFEDPAVVTGALGALFTLIGTVAGAYFGVKSSGDASDRAERQVDAANARTEMANKSARAALGALDSGKFENLREEGLL